MPESTAWKKMAETDFTDDTLQIGGLVEHPVTLSREALKEMGKE